jgi:hypothetical protein
MTKTDHSGDAPTAIELSSKYAALLYWKEIEPEGIVGKYSGNFFEPPFTYSESALSAISNIESLYVSIEQDESTPPSTLFRVSAICEIDDFDDKAAPLTDTDLAQIAFLLQRALHRSHWQMTHDQLKPKEHGWSRPYDGPFAWDEVTPSNEKIALEEVRQGDVYDWWLDERPFWDRRKEEGHFEKFQSLHPFKHWDEMVIYISYVSGVDESLGKWITNEAYFYETHENFSEVNFHLVSPKKYIDRLRKQFDDNFEVPD